jgi:hypothetical protein
MRQQMGTWRPELGGTTGVGAQNFAQARLGILQNALGNAPMFQGSPAGNGAVTNLSNQFGQLQGSMGELDPAAQWRRASLLLSQAASQAGMSSQSLLEALTNSR